MRTFGAVRAVAGIDFALPAGEFLTVFGPNGAGKSTLLRILGGGLRPSEGEVRIGGEALDYGRTDWRRRIGVLSHQTYLYDHLSARENLRFYGRLYGLDDLPQRISARLSRVGLADRADDRVRTYSRGMRQRLALVRTLLHDPEVVLLDEPYTGLDAHAAAVLLDVLTGLRNGRRSVVLVTHNLTQGLELADRLLIQVRGRIAWEGRPGELERPDFESFYREVVDTADESLGRSGAEEGIA